MISVGAQGLIPQEQLVKALHLYIDKLDVAQAKPLLMNLYSSKPKLGHNFPLQIRMWLVPELDSILNTKGQTNAEQLRACQNTWLAEKQWSSKPGRLNSSTTTTCTCRWTYEWPWWACATPPTTSLHCSTPLTDTGLRSVMCWQSSSWLNHKPELWLQACCHTYNGNTETTTKKTNCQVV